MEHIPQWLIDLVISAIAVWGTFQRMRMHVAVLNRDVEKAHLRIDDLEKAVAEKDERVQQMLHYLDKSVDVMRAHDEVREHTPVRGIPTYEPKRELTSRVRLRPKKQLKEDSGGIPAIVEPDEKP